MLISVRNNSWNKFVTEKSDCQSAINSDNMMTCPEAIRCTHPSCRCECFAPGRQRLRYCDTCSHGWVAHALDKLGSNLGLKMEMVQPNIVFDIASLMLYGAQATPVRLKILLDRLFAELQHEEILQILHGFGWTYEDYARGYILQDRLGRVVDNWCVATHEEELVILQQFLRFGETKAIAQEIILQDIKNSHAVLKQTHAAESGIKKFLERSNLSIQNYTMPYEYPPKCFVTRPYQFIQSANRIMPAPVMSQICGPSGESHFLSLLQAPVATSTPLRTSPLNRLDVLKHSDSPAEQPSPMVKLNHEGLDNCRSPNCESPQELSNTSSSLSHQSLQTHQKHQDQGSDEIDGSDSHISGSEDDVLDYSNKYISNSLPDEDKKVKHVRKSTNPMKREWAHSANFGSTFMGSNGKKRALCTVCNKTFCDKGALKIHYSAVHLKEMHKCTVEGCQMTFSSRRSRNRHSANLNPKLHMEHKNKSEFDNTEGEDISQLNELSPSITFSSSTNSISTMSLAPSIHSQIPSILNSLHSVTAMSNPIDFLSSSGKRIKLEHNQPTHVVTPCSGDEPCDLSRKFDNDAKLEIDLDRCSNGKEATIQEDESDKAETNNQWTIQETQGKDFATSKHAQNGESDRFSEGRHSLNLERDQMLHLRKNSTIENVDVVKRGSTYDVEKHVSMFQDVGSLCPQDSHEISKIKEARYTPKCASLQESGSATLINASKDGSDNEALTAGITCTINEEKNNGGIAGATASTWDHSEDNELPLGSDTIDVDTPHMDNKYPFQCKICCKSFKESFSLKSHFQKHHLHLMIPSDVDRSPAGISPKNNQTYSNC